MPYTIIGSLRSPFARICRMLMIQHGIPHEFRVLNFVDDPQAAAAVAAESPINRVPILVIDGERKLFDSRVIVNFLIEKHNLSKPTLDEENLISAIYSCMDSTVVLFLMKKDGFDVSAPGFFLSRQRARVPANLEFLTPWVRTLDAKNPKHWNYASMSLYAYLYWASNREMLEIAKYPVMHKFLADFAHAPGVETTGF